jgi:hypothetical protein
VARQSPIRTLSSTGTIQRDPDPESHTANAWSGGIDIDQIVLAIEDRVIAELDRRGGRYAGRF